MRLGAFENVRCDGRSCDKTIEVSLDWDDGSQSVDDSDDAVNDKLRYANWIVNETEADEHYCSTECAKTANEEV